MPTLRNALTTSLTSTLLLANPTVPPQAGPIPAQVHTQTYEDARSLLLAARSLQRRGGGDEPERSVALYRKVLALEPTSAEAHLRLSEALLEKGELAESLSEAKKAVAFSPRRAEAWAHLGILHQIQARTEKIALKDAQNALQQAANLMSTDVEIWTRLAESAENNKDDQTALRAWTRVGRLRPSFMIQNKTLTEVAWERALAIATKTQAYEARREAIMGLCEQDSADSKHLTMLENLAREQAEKGYLGHAEESFALLGQRYPKVSALWENMALLQIRTTRYDAALESLLKIETPQNSARVNYHIGFCLMNLGRFNESDSRFKEILTYPRGITPDEDRIYNNTRQLLVTSYLMQGLPEQALSFLAGEKDIKDQSSLLGIEIQALIQNQRYKDAHEALKTHMDTYSEIGIFQLAKKMPKDLIGLKPNAKAFRKPKYQKLQAALQQLDHEMMAGLFAEFRQWERCLDYILKVRQNSKAVDVDMLLLQGNALQELGRNEEAVTILREAQKQQPEHPMLQNNLGYLLLLQGDHVEEASQLIEKALQKDPNNGSTMDSWGWALYQQNRYEEAEKTLRKAVELSPFSPETLSHLGDVLIKLNRENEALEQWEKALAFAFPERKTLEQRARKLRVDINKKQQEQALDDSEGEEENPEPNEDFQED